MAARKYWTIEARAIERIRNREMRRQQNIEAIVVEAASALPRPEQVSNKPVDEDWTTRFFEECKDIGNKEMQVLWARILAREVSQPGSFSPRTLTVVRDLTKEDAELFARLCAFTWEIRDCGYVPIIYEVASRTTLSFADLTHLDTIGLVEFGSVSGFLLPGRTEVHAQYFGQAISIHREATHGLDIGKALLTVAGIELRGICGAQADEQYRVDTIDRWKKQGWTAISPADSRQQLAPTGS